MNVALAPPFIMKKFNVKGRVITFGGHLREGVQFFCRKLGKDIKDSPRIKKKKKKLHQLPPPPLINDSSLSKTIIYSFIISFTQPWLSRNIGVVIAWHFRYCRRSRLNKQIIEKEVTSGTVNVLSLVPLHDQLKDLLVWSPVQTLLFRTCPSPPQPRASLLPRGDSAIPWSGLHNGPGVSKHWRKFTWRAMNFWCNFVSVDFLRWMHYKR